MQTFETTIKVTQDDLDDLNHVNNVRYVQWVQDIAKAHWVNRATSEISDNYFWVLLTHTISYKSPAFLDDNITLKTYVEKSDGVTSIRIVEITNSKTNKLLAKSETTWCFMKTASNRPARIIEAVKKIFY